MNTVTKLVEEALSLPAEQRAFIADKLLWSLNVTNAAIDHKWAEVAKRRLGEIRSGEVVPIPGDEVFAEVHKRFAR